MGKVTISVLKVVIALSLAGSLVVQVVIVPTVWADLDDTPFAVRTFVIALMVLGVATMQVFAVCVWQLLTKVRKGSVFSDASFRYVDTIIWSIATAAVIALIFAVLLAPGEAAPGLVGLVCGASLVLGGVALLVVVMKSLLRQAIDREREASELRTELGEVI